MERRHVCQGDSERCVGGQETCDAGAVLLMNEDYAPGVTIEDEATKTSNAEFRHSPEAQRAQGPKE